MGKADYLHEIVFVSNSEGKETLPKRAERAPVAKRMPNAENLLSPPKTSVRLILASKSGNRARV